MKNKQKKEKEGVEGGVGLWKEWESEMNEH
jgi:hypothetical protein